LFASGDVTEVEVEAKAKSDSRYHCQASAHALEDSQLTAGVDTPVPVLVASGEALVVTDIDVPMVETMVFPSTTEVTKVVLVNFRAQGAADRPDISYNFCH
jgi:hypothetical protein